MSRSREPAAGVRVQCSPVPPPSPNLRRRSELELLDAVHHGDRHACRELVDAHRHAVGGLLHRMLAPSGRDAMVPDLAQETFLRVFRALDRFDPDGPARLSTWILTIASRLAISELRRKRPEIVDPSAISIPDRSGCGERGTYRSELRARVITAVGELAPPYRAAFILREWHGLDYAEIAQALEIETGTVKSRISRARARLREKLAELEHERIPSPLEGGQR